jgi:hypothetical protein
MQYAADVIAVDSQYGAAVTVSGTVPASAGNQTITKGSLQVTLSADSPSGNVTNAATGVTLAKYDFKAFGEPIKVEHLSFYASTTEGAAVTALKNGTIYANGQQIGSTADIKTSIAGATVTNYSFGSSLIVTPGTTVTVEVRADITDGTTNDLKNNDKIFITIYPYTSSAWRTLTQSYIGYTPGDDSSGFSISANQVTVSVGTLGLSKTANYGNQTITVPQTNYKLGSFILTGNSTEAVNLNTINVDFTASGTFTLAKLQNVYVKYGSNTTTSKSSVSTGTSTWSINTSLPINGTMTFDIYSDVLTPVTSGDSMRSNMLISGNTAASSQTANSAYITGQLITVGSGQFTAAVDGGTPVSALVKGGTTIDAAIYKFTATNNSDKITTIGLTVGAGGATAINQATLKDGTTVIATAPVSGTAINFNGLSLLIAANTSKAYTVSLDLGTIGTGAGSTGADVKLTLDNYKYIPTGGAETPVASANKAASDIYVYKAIPTITAQTIPTSILANGTQTIAKFTVSGDGTISWKRMAFTVSATGGATWASPKIYDASTNVEVTGATYSATTSQGSIVVTLSGSNEEQVSGSKTYVLKATIAGIGSGSASLQTYIDRPSTNYAAPAAYSAGSESFNWSDQAINGHDYTTADWNNDFLVKNLPTDTWSMSK